MIIYNIKDFKGINLYKCDYNKNQELLKSGFTPVYFDDKFYYYLLDDELYNYIKQQGGVSNNG